MSCPMCGEPDIIDGYCCPDHRQMDRHKTEANMLRACLLEIIHLGRQGAWYVEMARAAHESTARIL